MKKIVEKIEPIAGQISLVFGIVSIATLYWGIGVFVAIIGIIFGCIGYGYDNSKIACIGTILCFAVVGIVCVACVVDGKYIRFLKFR